MSTNAIVVKNALVAMFTASPSLGGAGVQISYGWLTIEPQRERVYMGKTTWTAKPRHFGLPLAREEDLVVDVVVDVEVMGGDEAAAEARAVTLGSVIESAIAADPTLGSTPGVEFAYVEGGDMIPGADEEQSMARLTYQVRVQSADT